MVYTAIWVIICYLPPIKGTRNSYWSIWNQVVDFSTARLSSVKDVIALCPLCHESHASIDFFKNQTWTIYIHRKKGWKTTWKCSKKEIIIYKTPLVRVTAVGLGCITQTYVEWRDHPYCWWFRKSHTTTGWMVLKPCNGISYQPQLMQDFLNQQYLLSFSLSLMSKA